MATYTTNYGLHQWVASDDFLRTDFNTDFQKIDAAIKAAKTAADSKSAVVSGSYTGNGAETRTITLGFQPQAVLVEAQDGQRGSSTQVRGGLAVTGSPVRLRDNTGAYDPAVQVTSTGFQVSRISAERTSTNESGTVYHYCAVQ